MSSLATALNLPSARLAFTAPKRGVSIAVALALFSTSGVPDFALSGVIISTKQLGLLRPTAARTWAAHGLDVLFGKRARCSVELDTGATLRIDYIDRTYCELSVAGTCSRVPSGSVYSLLKDLQLHLYTTPSH